jgi:hypothetical protein
MKSKSISLLLALTMFESTALATLGDSIDQSLDRYGKPEGTLTVSTGKVRVWYVENREMILLEFFNINYVVEGAIYYKLRQNAATDNPFTSAEIQKLITLNVSPGTQFNREVILNSTVDLGEKMWISNDKQFYLDRDPNSAVMGASLDGLAILTSAGILRRTGNLTQS